jgi:hypothetical protein
MLNLNVLVISTKVLIFLNLAYPICKKAAEAKGKDIDADLECMQYSYHVEKDCWPCICVVAHASGWKIKGCN